MTGPAVPPDPRGELLDVVDADDRVVGRARREEVYRRRLLHRTVMIVVRNPAGDVLVHRRTATKLVLPGRLDMMVGGVVDAGEPYDVAAARELAEETGITGAPLRPLPRLRYEPGDEPDAYPQWVAVYETSWAGPIEPQPTEVAWWDWLPETDLARLVADGPGEFCPDSLAVWARLRA